MILLDGKKLAEIKKAEIRKDIGGRYICLATVLVGDDPASHIYVNSKIKACSEVGITSKSVNLDSNVDEDELIAVINDLNEDDSVHGILLQLPLPPHINKDRVMEMINHKKDVDCFHSYNVGTIGGLAPATPTGIMMMLDSINYDLAGKNVLVIGRSSIVGRPAALLCIDRGATVTVSNSRTKNLKELALMADVIIAAAGVPKLLTADMVKEGAVVIDVGINRVLVDGKKKLVGDVDFENVKEKTYAITPVPGGVGPMTICALMYNCLKLYTNNRRSSDFV